MKRVSYQELQGKFRSILLKEGLTPQKAAAIANIFSDNTLDGVNSHGINRFPDFIKSIQKGEVQITEDPECVTKNGSLENWNGHNGPGMLNAHHCMERAIALAKENGIGCVSLFNTNHWMRGGTYGWQAAEAGCIGICFTNTIANMPPWGGKEARLGNNPLVIAVPRKKGNIVLDMAISQYSYGKMQAYELEGKQLPFAGGYDEKMLLTTDPKTIREQNSALPIGRWKGSGLALLLDIIVTGLTGGKSTKHITQYGTDTAISQCYIALHKKDYAPQLIEEILAFTKSATSIEKGREIRYPGEGTLQKRKENKEKGIPVHEKAWEALLEL